MAKKTRPDDAPAGDDGPAAPAGEGPAACDPNDRAANHPGKRRFKVRATEHTGAVTLYVLAASRAEAERFYRGHQQTAPDAALAVTELPD